MFADQWLTHMTMDIRVAGSENDAEENNSTGAVNLTSTDLELVTDANVQIVGMRFMDVQIPQAAAVGGAYIQFTVDETTNTNPCTLTIHAEDEDDAAAFSTAANDISSRWLTTAYVDWSPANWTIVAEAGPAQRTPDISPLIQEVVDRPGFTPGNSIVIVITGTGRRRAESYDGQGASAALLHVELE